jgi:hypothetical protein
MRLYSSSFLTKLSIILTLFVAFGAIPSGYGLITTNGLGMPQEWLINSPFKSFLIPGIILTFIVGGTQLAAAILMLKKHKYKIESTGIAGFGMIIWIFVQQYLIKQSSWLQVLYFFVGVTELIITILLFRLKAEHMK